MKKTILELSKEMNVSKQKIYRYIKNHISDVHQKEGVYIIDDVVESLIRKRFIGETVSNEVDHDVHQSESNDAVNDAVNDVVDVLKKTVKMLDNQLDRKDKQIDKLNELLGKEQQLNEHNQILLKQSQDQKQNVLLLNEKKSWERMRREKDCEKKELVEMEKKENKLQKEIEKLEKQQEEMVKKIECIDLSQLEIKESILFGSKTIRMRPESFEKVISLARVSELLKTKNKRILSENEYLIKENEQMEGYVRELLDQKKEANRQIELWKNLVHWMQDQVPGIKKYIRRYEKIKKSFEVER